MLHKNMAVQYPMPMPPAYLNQYQMGPDPYTFIAPQPHHQPHPYPYVTEEERELLEQLRAKKRASEQPPSSKQVVPTDASNSPPSMKKRKSLSDDPRKRGQPRGRNSRDGDHDRESDLDLNTLRLEGYEGADGDGLSPRPRPYPEIVVNAPVSRGSTPRSMSASTSSPRWSEDRMTPPSPHLYHDVKREGVPEDLAVVYEYSAPVPIPQRPPQAVALINSDDDSPAKNADWTFIASNRDAIVPPTITRGGHQRQRSAGPSIDFSPRSPFPNLQPTSSSAPSHIRARSEDNFNVPQQSNNMSTHFRVHSTGAW